MLNRRQFGSYVLGAAAAATVATESSAQLRPFVIRVVRTTGWEQLMQRELCIPGTVYRVDPANILSDNPGTQVCYCMELPQRGNKNEISAIPAGQYQASARLSNNNGPVIQLAGVPGRVAIQMHSGNTVDHTLGCILLGSTAVSQAPQQGSEILASGRCWIAGSKAARNELLAVYGWTDLTQQPPARPVMVIVS